MITYLVESMQIGSFNLFPLLMVILAFIAGFRSYGPELGALMSIIALVLSGAIVLIVNGVSGGDLIPLMIMSFILSIAYALYIRYRGT